MRRPVDAASPVPFEALEDPVVTVEAYVAHLDRTGLSPRTIRLYAHYARTFAAWLAGAGMHRPGETFTDPYSRDFALRDFRAHLVDRRLAPATIDAALNAVNGLFVWVGLGGGQVRRARPEGSGSFGAHLSREESKRVLRAAERRGARDLAVVATMRFAGLRVEEVARLNTDDWWATERAGMVRVHGKGEKFRDVPLSVDLRRVLQAWLVERRSWPGASSPALFVSNRGTRLATRSLHHLVRETGRAAGVELHPHMLRHTFARRLIEEGVPIAEVKSYLGHSDVATTMLYLRPSREERAAGIERGGEEW